jgi:hypothetical protein
MAVSVTYTFVDGTTIVAAQANQNFTDLVNYINALWGASDLKNEALLNTTKHGNLGTGNLHNSSQNYVLDTANHFLGTDIETVLAELGVVLNMTGGTSALAIEKYVGYDYDATTATDCSVVVPANSAKSKILISFGCFVSIVGVAANQAYNIPLTLNGTGLSATGAGRNQRFDIGMSIGSSTDINMDINKTAELSAVTYPTLNLTIDNTISFGTPFDVVDGTGACFWMKVSAV